MKTLVNEIRDMVRDASAIGVYPVFTDAASDLLGRSCLSDEDEAELFTKIADRIEREYLPRPRFDDGEPVQFGDEVELHYKSGGCGKCIIQAFHASKGPVWMLSFVGNDHERLLRYDSTCDVLKRLHPEVLDADGVPIKVGDVVWFVGGTEYFDVIRIESDGEVHIGRNDGTSTDAWAAPSDLTHKQPDTLERIDDDAKKDFWDYWGCGHVSCEDCPALIDGKTPKDHYHTDSCGYAESLDLLRRQREILERGHE